MEAAPLLDYLLSFGPEVHFAAFILGSARLMTFALAAPALGNAALEMTARSALVLALYLVIHPAMLEAVSASGLLPLDAAGWVRFAGLLAKEIFIGFALGWVSGLVFWAFEGAGIFIDNQRGASTASESNPFTGAQSTPTGSFLFQSTTYAFFASGAFVAMLALIYSTYEWWPAAEFLPAALFQKEGAALFFGERVAALAADIILISAPIVLACLFTDAALGLINRFASQLNVYVLAMPIKCGIASFLLLIYFAMLMTDAPQRFAAFGIDVSALKTLSP